jgi:hypothetical protein
MELLHRRALPTRPIIMKTCQAYTFSLNISVVNRAEALATKIVESEDLRARFLPSAAAPQIDAYDLTPADYATLRRIAELPDGSTAVGFTLFRLGMLNPRVGGNNGKFRSTQLDLQRQNRRAAQRSVKPLTMSTLVNLLLAQFSDQVEAALAGAAPSTPVTPPPPLRKRLFPPPTRREKALLRYARPGTTIEDLRAAKKRVDPSPIPEPSAHVDAAASPRRNAGKAKR